MILLSVREVASQLGFAAKTVRHWVREGKLRGVRLGRHWRIDQDDLAAFIAKRRT
jgi:excisionase family DNA binding protein